MARKARGSYTPTEWERETGIPRPRWTRWESGAKPDVDGFWEMAEVLKISPPALLAELDGEKFSPGETMAELVQRLGDREFSQLCAEVGTDRLAKWIGLITEELASRITQDSSDKSR